jgi:hypothetical protein
MSCVAQETARGWKITKEKSSSRIDIIVALAMAAYGAFKSQNDYVERPAIGGFGSPGVPDNVPGSFAAVGEPAAPAVTSGVVFSSFDRTGLAPLPPPPPPPPPRPLSTAALSASDLDLIRRAEEYVAANKASATPPPELQPTPGSRAEPWYGHLDSAGNIRTPDRRLGSRDWMPPPRWSNGG